MALSQTTVVTGTDVTAIATTAIKTVGDVLTSFTGALMIGSILFVVVIIISIVAVIIVLKKNCVNIKNGITGLSKALPIPTFQLKIIASLIGMFCPGDGKEPTTAPVGGKDPVKPSFVNNLM